MKNLRRSQRPLLQSVANGIQNRASNGRAITSENKQATKKQNSNKIHNSNFESENFENEQHLPLQNVGRVIQKWRKQRQRNHKREQASNNRKTNKLENSNFKFGRRTSVDAQRREAAGGEPAGVCRASEATARCAPTLKAHHFKQQSGKQQARRRMPSRQSKGLAYAKGSMQRKTDDKDSRQRKPSIR